MPTPPFDPLNPRDRIAAIVSDMRACILQDRLSAEKPDIPAPMRAILQTNSVLLHHWANVLEHVLETSEMSRRE